MFDKLKKLMKLNESRHVNDEDWNEQLERNGGLEKHDFLAMVIAAGIVILPVALVLLLLLAGISCIFLLL